jgi:hypothetical protein
MENKIVRHLLVFKASRKVTPEGFDEFIRAFRDLSTKIGGILSFEHGPNNSPEGLDQGMNHVISLTFVDAAARDAYLIHPEHVSFANWLGIIGIFENLIVIDYTPNG